MPIQQFIIIQLVILYHRASKYVSKLIRTRLTVRLPEGVKHRGKLSKCCCLRELMVHNVIGQYIFVTLNITVLTKKAFYLMSSSISKGRGKKNWEKAVRLTAWVDPPSPKAVRVL